MVDTVESPGSVQEQNVGSLFLCEVVVVKGVELFDVDFAVTIFEKTLLSLLNERLEKGGDGFHNSPSDAPVNGVSNGDRAEPVVGKGFVLGNHKKAPCVETCGGADPVGEVDEDIQDDVGGDAGADFNDDVGMIANGRR